MAYEFKISGEIVRDDEAWMLFNCFSPSMLDQYLDDAKGEDLFIDINSIGGNVDSGITIYSRLRRYASRHKAKITTRTDGYVASIATAIFLAGDTRIVNEFMQPFVHNPSVDAYIGGLDAEELEEISENLEKTQNMLAEFYSKNTNLTKDEALRLMDEDTWITSEDCITYGFATEIEELSNAEVNLVAALKNRVNLKTKKVKKMAKSKTLAQKLAKAVLGIGGNDDVENKKILDASQKEIDFPDVDADASIAVGDKANVDGKVAQGEFVIPSPEDAEKTWKLVFDKGVLTSINKEGGTDETEDDTDAQAEEIANLKSELKDVKSKLALLTADAQLDKAKIEKYEDALNKIAAIEPDTPEQPAKSRQSATEPATKEKGGIVREALKGINFELTKK